MTGVDIIIKGEGKTTYKLRADRRGVFLVFPDKDPLRPRAVNLGPSIRVPITVWPDKEGDLRGFKEKLPWVIGNSVVHWLMKEVVKGIPPEDLVKLTKVEIKSRSGSVHVSIMVPEDERLIKVLRSLRKLGEPTYYGARRMFGEKFSREDMLGLLKRENIFFTERIEGLVGHLKKYGVDTRTLYQGVQRVRRLMEEYVKEERKVMDQRERMVKLLAKEELPRVRRLEEALRTEVEEEVSRLRRELRKVDIRKVVSNLPRIEDIHR